MWALRCSYISLYRLGVSCAYYGHLEEDELSSFENASDA